ncbi:glycosyltransferase family 2 protein [Zunongwangia sp. H14]|uniref:glycosyltransferase family 2 protein n=1 Tax=Zunongwangia sp. H14 TaxID=3240792 RepID=UPI0035615D9E
MDKKLSIIYAFRDRDLERVKLSLDSLHKQYLQNFEVIFVDYGSEESISTQVEYILKEFDFCCYFYLHTSQKLWNKSRALNFGIKNSTTNNIFIADIDLLFSSQATSYLEDKISSDTFYLFRMAYLNRKNSKKVYEIKDFDLLKHDRTGDVNGMILAPKDAFYKVSGYDEFFHFYGAEDVDLYARIRNAGYHEIKLKDIYFYHNWHQSFQNSEQKALTFNPRLKNAMRINQQHYFNNLRNNIIKPVSQSFWGNAFEKQEADELNFPEAIVHLENIAAVVEHFMNEGIKYYKNKILQVQVSEADYFSSLKHIVKKRIGKQSQIYISLKEVSDIILKKIIFEYRDYNYSYEVTPDLKTIVFKIKL